MSDDEPDLELLALLRQSLGINQSSEDSAPDTGVLSSASFIVDNAIDVAISPSATKSVASTLSELMRSRKYSTEAWSAHDLHPKPEDGEESLDFIFTMDLLNFSFWSERDEESRFAVEYRGQRWIGYWSLVACLQRALEEGTPITDPHFWLKEDILTEEALQTAFRSSTSEQMPMISERLECLREAGRVLCEKYDGKFLNCITSARGSAARLVNLLVRDFPCFRDEHVFEGRTVHIYKRAQILVADVWGCFNGHAYGDFGDIDSITMFADYRIPQILHSHRVLMYSPSLEARLRRKQLLTSGSQAEVEIRGCSIWAIELMKREMLKTQPEGIDGLNSILIDFFLFDTFQANGSKATTAEGLPHHRCRSIWY